MMLMVFRYLLRYTVYAAARATLKGLGCAVGAVVILSVLVALAAVTGMLG